MAEDGVVFRVTSEEDAWKLFQAAVENNLGAAKDFRIAWEGWPIIRIYLPNVPEDATISTSMMEAILKLQTSIYRTHAILLNGDASLRTLTKFEREQFELRVKVEKGSSDLSINLPDIIAKYGNDIVAKMTGTELVVMILGLALIWAGKVVVSEYLNAKTTERKLVSDDEKTKQLLTNYQSQLEHDTARYEMLTKAIEARPVLKQIENTAKHAKDEIVKAVAEEKGGILQGVELPQEVANEISSTSRTQSTEARTKGSYKVAKVDTTAPDGFRVTLEDVKSGELIVASLVDAIISETHKERLQQAEWKKKPVIVELAGRRLRGKMVDAKIVDVREDQV